MIRTCHQTRITAGIKVYSNISEIRIPRNQTAWSRFVLLKVTILIVFQFLEIIEALTNLVVMEGYCNCRVDLQIPVCFHTVRGTNLKSKIAVFLEQ